MTMIPREPYREMVTLRQAMDRLLGQSLARPLALWPEIGVVDILIDMYQTDKDVVVKATLPGVEAEDVEISVSGDILTIKGEHCEEEQIDGGITSTGSAAAEPLTARCPFRYRLIATRQMQCSTRAY